jgi:hypothetical protein
MSSTACVDANVLAVRIAPMLLVTDLAALRCVSRQWQDAVDALLVNKAAFVRVPLHRVTLAAARYALLYGRSELQPDSLRTLDTAAAKQVCVGHGIEAAKWVWQKLELAAMEPGCEIELLGFARTVDVAEWLCDVYRHQPWYGDLCAPLPTAVRRSGVLAKVCEYGSLAVLQWILANFGTITEADRIYSSDSSSSADSSSDDPSLAIERDATALHASCRGGRLEILQWLMDLSSPPLRPRFTCIDGFLAACAGGHVDTAKWLAEHLNINVKKDLTDIAENLFLTCCSSGRLEMVEWAVAHFQLRLTQSDATAAFPVSVRAGGLDICRWLDVRFRFQLDFVANHWVAVLVASQSHLAVFKWIVKRFRISGDDLVLNNVGSALCPENPAVAVWMLQHLSIPRSLPSPSTTARYTVTCIRSSAPGKDVDGPAYRLRVCMLALHERTGRWTTLRRREHHIAAPLGELYFRHFGKEEEVVQEQGQEQEQESDSRIAAAEGEDIRRGNGRRRSSGSRDSCSEEEGDDESDDDDDDDDGHDVLQAMVHNRRAHVV